MHADPIPADSLALKLRRAPGIMDRKALDPLLTALALDDGSPSQLCERPTIAERLDHYRDEERYEAIDREREDCEKNEPEFLEADGPWGNGR